MALLRHVKHTRTRRKGIHAKTKMSPNKGADNYTKINVGQGK